MNNNIQAESTAKLWLGMTTTINEQQAQLRLLEEQNKKLVKALQQAARDFRDLGKNNRAELLELALKEAQDE